MRLIRLTREDDSAVNVNAKSIIIFSAKRDGHGTNIVLDSGYSLLVKEEEATVFQLLQESEITLEKSGQNLGLSS